MKATDKIKGITAALISSGTFGLIPLFSIPLMTAGMNTTSILLYRYLISAVAVAILCGLGKKSLKIPFKTALKLFGMSLLYTTTAIALLYSYNFLASGIVTTINFLYPVVVVIFMTLIYKEKISIRLIMTSIFALIGVGFLCSGEGGNISMIGLALAGSTAITYALYIVGLSDKDIKSVDGTVVTLYVLVFGSIIFLAINTFMGFGFDAVPNLASWVNILMLALFPTVVSVLTLIAAVKYIGSTTTSILGAAEPLIAMLIGVTVFSEQFTAFSLVGLMIIVAAVTYVIIITNREDAEPVMVEVRERKNSRE